MKLLAATMVLLLAASHAEASWGFTANLTSSGCQGYVPSMSIPLSSGFPDRSSCESTRSQILAIRQCGSNGKGGTCCVFYSCSACTGSDDPKPGMDGPGGKRMSAKELKDFEKDTRERIKVLGDKAGSVMESMKSQSSGDAGFDSDYQSLMADAYASDSGTVDLRGAKSMVPKIPGSSYTPPELGPLGSARFSAEELAGFSPEEFARYLKSLSPEEKQALAAEMQKQLGRYERQSKAYTDRLEKISGLQSEVGYEKALIETVRNTTLVGAVAGLAYDLFKGDERADASAGEIQGKSIDHLVEKVQERYPGIPLQNAKALVDLALAYQSGDKAKLAEQLGKAALELSDPKILIELSKHSAVAKGAFKEAGEGFVSTGIINASKSAGSAGAVISAGEKVIELTYQAGLVRQDNIDIRTSNEQKASLRIRLEEEKAYAESQAEKLRRLKSQMEGS